MRPWRVFAVLALLDGCTPRLSDKDLPGESGEGVPDSRHSGTEEETGETGESGTRPRNVVIVLSDDQAPRTLWAMPRLAERLTPEAVTFDRAYVTVPMCCPMRASFLSGGWFPKDTHVLSNKSPNGGVSRFEDTDTLATRLQAAGVATGLFGKYLNHYAEELAPTVPPGWDTWMATGTGDGAYDNTVIFGGSGPSARTEGVFVDTGGEHLTAWLFAEALALVDAHPTQPFFRHRSNIASGRVHIVLTRMRSPARAGLAA